MSKNQENPETAARQELASVHTNGFTELLSHFGISLAISTYQAGKLILARADGGVTNTHFHSFNKPMGMAATADRIALGTAAQIWDLRNVPAAAAQQEPKGKHDACYVNRAIHTTGDVDIHEMAWAGEELWFINTRFSCLCTLDSRYSFVPRWRPPFISAYDMRDRCHLNGLAFRDGKARYVTALGETDEPGGWRRNKASGGILMDISNNEFLLRGLSMPHSPRWHGERLWFLESGRGSLNYYDADSGKSVAVAELPGFTRGLDFVGDYAIIGLSQVRETAVFSGLPLTQTQPVRYSGVWIVDIRDGEIKAFLRFEKGVQEIFAVAALPWRFPAVIEDDTAIMGSTYVLPDEVLKQVVQPSKDWSFAENHFEAGNSLYNQGESEKALEEYKKCLQMQPGFLPARYNLGVALGNLDRHPEAIEQLKQVVAEEAGHAEALNSLGFSYGQLLEDDLAIEHLQRAVKIQPDYAQAHHNLGLTLLRQGKFKEGWDACEWRWRTDQFQPFEAPHPLWDGNKLEGTLLVHTEQGAGDAIQFARYLAQCAEYCTRLILVCPENLLRLFGAIPGVDLCRGPGDINMDDFQAHISLMSLPRIFATRPDNIPDKVPYLEAQANKDLSLPHSGARRVGIVWAGNSGQANDQFRSCTIEMLLPLLRIPGIDFFSLQKGEQAADLNTLPEDVQITDLDSLIDDYADTAALVEQLDLVISVDTSVAHLAGALNVPVWVAVYYNADWRYQRDSEHCPWYPGMRQFWQATANEWDPLFDNMSEELAAWRDSDDPHE